MASKVILGQAGQVRPLGQILAQQSIGVLVRAALPGAMRVGEEYTFTPVRSVSSLCPAHFLALVVGQGLAHGLHARFSASVKPSRAAWAMPSIRANITRRLERSTKVRTDGGAVRGL